MVESGSATHWVKTPNHVLYIYSPGVEMPDGGKTENKFIVCLWLDCPDIYKFYTAHPYQRLLKLSPSDLQADFRGEWQSKQVSHARDRSLGL
jgi:hypothetical protein